MQSNESKKEHQDLAANVEKIRSAKGRWRWSWDLSENSYNFYCTPLCFLRHTQSDSGRALLRGLFGERLSKKCFLTFLEGWAG